MPSAEQHRRRVLRRILVAGSLAASVVAPSARADVVRLSTTASDDGQDAARVVSVVPATGRLPSGVPATGLPESIDVLTRSPNGGLLGYVGTLASGGSGVSPGRVAGVLPVAGGPVRAFVGLDGRPLTVGRDEDDLTRNEGPDRWITWAPSGASLVLHAFDAGGVDPWFSRPTARTCDVPSGRCGAVRHEDAVHLPGGGTVRIAASLVAAPGSSRSTDTSWGAGALTAKRARKRVARRFAVGVRVTGRTGATDTWATTGRLRRGAPAYDRSYPSRAGVLVRFSTVRFDPAEHAYDGLDATAGPAVVVHADGTMRRIARLPYDVVGTLPDGRWILAGGAEEGPVPRPAAGEPLRTLDADGRIAVLRSGDRAITPIWASYVAGLPDSRSSASAVVRAGVDPTTGLLVLAMRAPEEGLLGGLSNDALVTVPLDGSAPPRLRPGAPVGGRAPVATIDLPD